MFEKVTQKVKGAFHKMRHSQRLQMAVALLVAGTTAAMAQNAAGDYTAGTNALGQVTTEIYFCQNQTKYHTFNFILKAYNSHSFSTIYNDIPYFNNT